MSETHSRRITADNPHGLMVDRADNLKHVAGLIQKLSFRDMTRLCQLISPEGGAAELANKILDVADTILHPEFKR